MADRAAIAAGVSFDIANTLFRARVNAVSGSLLVWLRRLPLLAAVCSVVACPVAGCAVAGAGGSL